MRKSRIILCQLLLAVSLGGLFTEPARAAAIRTTFDVFIDTTVVNGLAGLIDFQFNPGSAAAPAASALVSNVTGAMFDANPPVLDGNTVGAMPGNVTFDNGAAFNALLQGVQTFNSMFAFRVDFGGAFLTAGAGDGTTFSLALLAPDLSVLPGFSTDPTGRIVAFELFPGNISFTAFDPAVRIAAVPEPQTVLLLLMGLVLAVALSASRRGHV